MCMCVACANREDARGGSLSLSLCTPPTYYCPPPQLHSPAAFLHTHSPRRVIPTSPRGCLLTVLATSRAQSPRCTSCCTASSTWSLRCRATQTRRRRPSAAPTAGCQARGWTYRAWTSESRRSRRRKASRCWRRSSTSWARCRPWARSKTGARPSNRCASRRRCLRDATQPYTMAATHNASPHTSLTRSQCTPY